VKCSALAVLVRPVVVEVEIAELVVSGNVSSS
jgi:hypothetical protein